MDWRWDHVRFHIFWRIAMLIIGKEISLYNFRHHLNDWPANRSKHQITLDWMNTNSIISNRLLTITPPSWIHVDNFWPFENLDWQKFIDIDMVSDERLQNESVVKYLHIREEDDERKWKRLWELWRFVCLSASNTPHSCLALDAFDVLDATILWLKSFKKLVHCLGET